MLNLNEQHQKEKQNTMMMATNNILSCVGGRGGDGCRAIGRSIEKMKKNFAFRYPLLVFLCSPGS